MKIGTLSLNINTPDYNYGAMLHSYSFILFLKKYNNYIESAEIIDYKTQSVVDYKRIIEVPDSKKRNKIRDIITLSRMKYSYWLRHHKFRKFVRNNMIVSKKKYKSFEISNAALPYDCLICESDVIWSPLISGGSFLFKFSKYEK